MLIGSRMHHAIGRCVAASLVLQIVAVAECSAQSDGNDIRNYSQRNDGYTSDSRTPRQPEFIFIAPVAIADKKQAEANTYQPDCEQPKSAEDGNFCQARRNAKAAEDAARAGEDSAKAAWKAANVAEQQLRLTYAALFGVLVTVILTFWAAHATSKSAKAAREMVAEAVKTTREAKRQTDLAEESFNRLERPYIYIFGVHQIETSRGVKNHVEYSVANFGRTPAAITILAAGMSTHTDGPLKPLIVDYRDDPSHDLLVRPILPPNDVRNGLLISPPYGIDFHAPEQTPGVFALTHQNLVPILNWGEQFFVWIRIQYRGPNGGYMTNACWRFDELTNRLVPWGEDQEFNGMI